MHQEAAHPLPTHSPQHFAHFRLLLDHWLNADHAKVCLKIVAFHAVRRVGDGVAAEDVGLCEHIAENGQMRIEEYELGTPF